jgi:hypothetical protein
MKMLLWVLFAVVMAVWTGFVALSAGMVDWLLSAVTAGQISGVLESPLGYHLLWCEAIQEERELGLEQARSRIREMLEQHRKRICQQAWLKQLPLPD